MKKAIKILSISLSSLIAVCGIVSGCKKKTYIDKNEEESKGIMQDIDVMPEQNAVYEDATKQALAEYNAVAAKYTVDGEADSDNPEVMSVATRTAAKLYAYACYNERYLDQYSYFSNQTGGTDLGSVVGSAQVLKQDYYVRVNESEDTCGYRYHYTLKKVQEAYGSVSGFKGLFESARLRMTDQTDLLYRFEGENMVVGEYNDNLACNLIECDWATTTDDDEWGVPDVEMVKGEYIAPEDIEDDIIQSAYGDDDVTIHGNINILAENIVKYAMILNEEDSDCITVLMNIDTQVANADDPSVTMLTKVNGTSGNCTWKSGTNDPQDGGMSEDTGLCIVFRIWNNGLFRSYSINERWTGKIVGFTGTAESEIHVDYSYSDRDCDMTSYLNMLEQAKTARESK